jgi:hypothetical protein
VGPRHTAMSPSRVQVDFEPSLAATSHSGQSPMLAQYTREIVPDTTLRTSEPSCVAPPLRRSYHRGRGTQPEPICTKRRLLHRRDACLVLLQRIYSDQSHVFVLLTHSGQRKECQQDQSTRSQCQHFHRHHALINLVGDTSEQQATNEGCDRSRRLWQRCPKHPMQVQSASPGGSGNRPAPSSQGNHSQ